MGIFYTPLDKSENYFESQKVAFIEFVLVAAAKKYISNFDPEFFSEKICYVGSRIEDYKKEYPAFKMYKLLGLNPKNFIETNNQETQKRLVLAGLGYTIVPKHVVAEEVKKGQLMAYEIPKKIGSALVCVKRKNHILSKAAQVFQKLLQQELLGL